MEEIAENLESVLGSFREVMRVEGFEACIDRKAYRQVKETKVDGDFEAHLVAISCSKVPEGYGRWSLRMLADKMIELKYVESISHETIR